MVDLLDEVEEDLRAERAARLMKRFGWLLAAAAAIVVAAASGYQLWQRWQSGQDAAIAARYVAALNAIEQAPAVNAAARAGQIATLDQVAASGHPGYRTLATLRAAGLAAESGDVPRAVGLWNAIAADPAIDPLLRDLASLQASAHQLDQADPAMLAARLGPLAVPGGAWAPLARELLAALDLRLGKTTEARATLQALANDSDAPAGARARASALLAGL